MHIDNLTVVIRPRSLFEGIDLGFVLARKYFLSVWLIFFLTALPVFVILNICFSDNFFLFWIILIWLKPLYEAAMLHWLGFVIFNKKLKIFELIKKFPEILKRQLFMKLTYRRLSPCRSFYLPVIMLEKLKGKEYADRVNILGYNQSAGIGLTFICFLFELTLFASITALLFMIIPDDLMWFNFDDLFEGDNILTSLMVNSVYFLSISIIAPFYVSAGFALYLTRRTEFEAWDIELKLRGLLKRKKEMEAS